MGPPLAQGMSGNAAQSQFQETLTSRPCLVLYFPVAEVAEVVPKVHDKVLFSFSFAFLKQKESHSTATTGNVLSLT